MPPNHPLNKSFRVTYVTIAVLLSALTCYAQRLDPDLVNVAGFSIETADYEGFMSLGEVAITTESGPGGTITQGFLQPEVSKPCSDFQLQYYPNPVTDKITVLDELCGRKISKIVVYDMNGRLVNSYPLHNREANLELLIPGIFLVRAYGYNNEFLGDFKIIKSEMIRG